MVDLLCKQFHEVDGYVKRDEIITLHTSNNEMSHHFVISMSMEDRLVVDALTDVLYFLTKPTLTDNNIYLGGIRDDYRNELNSWDNVHSVAVFNVKPLLFKLDRHILWDNLQKIINADSQVFQLFAHLFPRNKEDLYQYESYREDFEEGVPFQGLPLRGSLPIVLITRFSSLDPCVKKFIGEWPYVRINYDFIFPISTLSTLCLIASYRFLLF